MIIQFGIRVLQDSYKVLQDRREMQESYKRFYRRFLLPEYLQERRFSYMIIQDGRFLL